jgi:hypothetical protein
MGLPMVRTIAFHQFVPRNAVLRILLQMAALWPIFQSHWASGQTEPSKEYQIKAACLLNFVQFIQWPSTVFPDPGTPITIGILGDDPFGQTLEKTFQDELVQSRKLAVKRSRQIEDLKDCHILFISKSEKSKIEGILAKLGDSATATVGETDDFAKQGGIINFYLDNNKVRFEINADAGQRKGLKISSQMLKRARIVTTESRSRKE